MGEDRDRPCREHELWCVAMQTHFLRSIGRESRTTRVFAHQHHRLLVVLIVVLSIVGCPRADPLQQARELLASGNFADCVLVLREAIDSGADEPEVFYLYGVALAGSGELDAAIWPLRRAMESPEWKISAALQLATGAFMQQSWDNAIKTLDQVLEIEPEHTQALVLRSRARIESRRDYEGALGDAVRALEIDPDADQARITRVVALLALDRVDEAGEALESMELLSREAAPGLPETARFCGARASFASEKGDKQAADEIYASCLKEFPGSSILVEAGVKFYQSLRRADRVIEILEAAVADSPNDRDYRVGLVVRLAAQGREEEAEAILRKGTEAKNPSIAVMAWLDFAGYLLENGRHGEGIEAFDRAIELVPDPPPDLLFRYADALIIADRFDQALEVAARMEVSVYRDLIRGRVHLERGEPALALERLTEGLQSWPENAVVRYYAALAAEQVGDYARSVEEFRYAIRAGASQTNARSRLARLHMAEGLFQEAWNVLIHDISRQPADVEMAVIALELGARLGVSSAAVSQVVPALRSPDDWRRALLAAARGTRARAGPAAAASLIQAEISEVDLADSANASILERLVVNLVEADRAEEAEVLVDGCLDSQPETGAFHAIRSWILARRHGVGSEQSSAALLRAVEFDPRNSVALIGLGHDRAVAGEPDDALSYFDRAIEANPDDPAPLRAAIDLLYAESRAGESETRLEKLLELEPYDAAAALRLAEILVERNPETKRAIALGKLALRFGRDGTRAEAIEWLKQVDVASR